jgi:hypothetical protein
MESRAAWDTETREAFDAIEAALDALDASLASGPESLESCDPDTRRRLGDEYLAGLAEVARLEVRIDALMVRVVAEYAQGQSAPRFLSDRPGKL